MSALRYMCFFAYIVVSNTYCLASLFCLASSCVPYVARLSIFDFPLCIL